MESVGHAVRGVGALLRREPNARLHAVAAAAVAALGVWLRLEAFEWVGLVLAVAIVWMAEAFNTALERLADAVSPERHPLVGEAKDVAAAAVLLSAIGAALVGLLVLGPRLAALLTE